MTGRLWPRLLVLTAPLLACSARAPATAARSDRVQIVFDATEAEAALAILDSEAAGQSPPEHDFERLFASEGFVRLVAREKQIGSGLEKEDVRAFLASPATQARRIALRQTLQRWRSADLGGASSRATAYLPPEATLRVTVFPVVKPKPNTFVFEPKTHPAIFFALDPELSRPQFENTLAHELHHIGFASLPEPAGLAELDPAARRAADWISAFGEGFAMLAAAGGPDVHPHRDSKPEDRARWDRDVARFDEDVPALERFFLRIVHGELATDAEIMHEGRGFFGVQGAFYTVGWSMAVVVERRFGREVLIACMRDPRQILATFDAAVADPHGLSIPTHATWSSEVVAAVHARSLGH